MQGLKRRFVYVDRLRGDRDPRHHRRDGGDPRCRAGPGRDRLGAGVGGRRRAGTSAWNWLFEAWEARQPAGGRGVLRRVAHAIGFEGGLLVFLVPLMAWSLGIGLVEAFVLDLGFLAFFLVYTFVFNLAFDTLFGLPASAARA